ncbi:hypothetical protein ACQKQC_06190 [Vibrio fortis]|uniref:hypothetical protein n=1 Tax=Vibrio fortis TaxID=212667 RepID=UPI004068E76F
MPEPHNLISDKLAEVGIAADDKGLIFVDFDKKRQLKAWILEQQSVLAKYLLQELDALKGQLALANFVKSTLNELIDDVDADFYKAISKHAPIEQDVNDEPAYSFEGPTEHTFDFQPDDSLMVSLGQAYDEPAPVYEESTKIDDTRSEESDAPSNNSAPTDTSPDDSIPGDSSPGELKLVDINESEFSLVEENTGAIVCKRENNDLLMHASHLFNEQHLKQFAKTLVDKGAKSFELQPPEILNDRQKAQFIELAERVFTESGLELRTSAPSQERTNRPVEPTEAGKKAINEAEAIIKAISNDQHKRIANAVTEAVKSLPEKYDFVQLSKAINSADKGVFISLVDTSSFSKSNHGFGFQYKIRDNGRAEVYKASSIGSEEYKGIKNLFGGGGYFMNGFEVSSTRKEAIKAQVEFAVDSLDNQTEEALNKAFREKFCNLYNMGFEKVSGTDTYRYYLRGKKGEDKERYSLEDMGITLTAKEPIIQKTMESLLKEEELAEQALAQENDAEAPKMGETLVDDAAKRPKPKNLSVT